MTGARLALLTAALALAAPLLAPAALACARGYSYAGLYASSPASGIAVTIGMLGEPKAVGPSSHVAGWVGVGGPALGPHVGLATFGDSRPTRACTTSSSSPGG